MPVTYTPGSRITMTPKQRQIMTVICLGDGKDENGQFIPIDMNQLLDRLAYETTKQSMQFSLRALKAKGFVTKDYCKRRSAKRVVYFPTRLGRSMLGLEDPSFVEAGGDFSYLDIED